MPEKKNGKKVKRTKTGKFVTMYQGKHVIDIDETLVKCHKECGWKLEKDK
jgi:hypothetical protein